MFSCGTSFWLKLITFWTTLTYMCVCVYIYDFLYIFNCMKAYIIVISQILSTLQIISHLICHQPSKWDSDNQHCYNIYIYIYIHTHTHTYIIIIIIMSCPARISLTLSRHFSLSFIASGRSSGLHPVSSQSCCMYVRAGRPAFAYHGSK